MHTLFYKVLTGGLGARRRCLDLAHEQSRFQPNPLVIKKRIEGLIERDFLQRQRGDMQTYEYLA